MSASCLAIATPGSLSSSERGVNPGEADKGTYLNELGVRTPLMVSIS